LFLLLLLLLWWLLLSPASMASKRASTGSAAMAKRQRVEEVVPKTREQQLSEIEQALELAQDLSVTGREMLRLVVKGSLGEPAEARHRYQSAAAGMVQEVLEGVEASLCRGLDSAKEGVGVASTKRHSSQQEIRQRKEAFVARIEAIEQAKAAFLADNRRLQTESQALEICAEARRACEVTLKKAVGCRDELEVAVNTQLPAIIESGPTPALLEAVIPLLAQLPMEDSLRNAASASVRLQPEARGMFDKTVLGQVASELAKLFEAAPKAEAETADAEAARATEAEAQSRFAEARAQQVRSAHGLREAELTVREAEGAEGVASEALQDAEEAIHQASLSQQAAEKSLECFREGPMASLEVLLSGRAAGEIKSEAPLHVESERGNVVTAKADVPSESPTAGVPTPTRAPAAFA